MNTSNQNSQGFRYGLVNRPAGLGCLPKEAYKLEAPLTDDLGSSLSRHGIAVFDRPLTEQEICAFELCVIADGDLQEEMAIEVALEMGEYAQAYVKMADTRWDQFHGTVQDRLRSVRKYRVHVGDLTRFSAMVKARLENIAANTSKASAA